jgi:hypothetical protein
MGKQGRCSPFALGSGTMARRSLRPQLNQIRTWVQQGRTDAWIAHQLEVTVQQIDTFKKENELAPAEADANGSSDPGAFDDEIDLRAQDDELIAAELEKAEAERLEREAAEAEAKAKADEEAAAERARRIEAGEDPDEIDEEAKPRRRGRRGGRGRARKAAAPLEATFDHGDEGYGLWMDPAVADDPIYAEHWAGHRPVVVTVEEDQLIIRRAGEEPAAAED